MPLLKSTAQIPDSDVRIVTISSTAPQVFLPKNFEFEFDKLSGLYSPVSAYPWSYRMFFKFLFYADMILYSVSKAGTQIYASELQKLFDQHNLPILSLIVHPGEVATEGLMNINNMVIRTVARLTFLSSEQGAASPLFAATAPVIRQDQDHYKGSLLMPGGNIASLHPVVMDEKQARGLWNLMTKELDQHLIAERLPALQKW